ncbi:MAG: hypothetical protein DRJ64_01670, partial [Thermoprotei archaeon]
DLISTGLIKDLLETDGKEVITGNEGFEFLDKVLYKIDKAFENSIKGVMGYFQNTNIFIEDLIEYKTKTPSITNLHKVRPTFIKKTSTMKFRTVENRKVPVLLGLRLSYNELHDTLASNVSYVNGLEDAMGRFNLFLDILLDSKKDVLTVNVDKGEVNALHSNVKNINKSLDVVTSDKALKDRIELGRMAKDFREMSKTINDTLKLGSVYKMENLENIHELNEEVSAKLDILYGAVKGKNGVMSKNDIRAISEYIGSMAKMVTAVAFLFYLYYQLVDMLVAAVKVVELEDTDNNIVDKTAMLFKDGYGALLNVFK